MPVRDWKFAGRRGGSAVVTLFQPPAAALAVRRAFERAPARLKMVGATLVGIALNACLSAAPELFRCWPHVTDDRAHPEADAVADGRHGPAYAKPANAMHGVDCNRALFDGRSNASRPCHAGSLTLLQPAGSRPATPTVRLDLVKP